MPAFASALKAGTQSIEMDIVRTRDDVAVIIHDATLDGTTNGQGAVGDFTLDEVQALDAGGWFSDAYAGVRIPTFTQFAALMAQHPDVEILLEFKGAWDVPHVQHIVDVVAEHNVSAQTILQSFNRKSIEAMLEVAPDARRGVLIYEDFDGLVEQCVKAGIYTINPDVRYVLKEPSFVRKVHDAGMKVQVWTANDPQQWEQLVELHVDGIITDSPDHLRGWMIGKNFM